MYGMTGRVERWTGVGLTAVTARRKALQWFVLFVCLELLVRLR